MKQKVWMLARPLMDNKLEKIFDLFDKFLALSAALIGLFGGLYIGIWLMLFGGFADAINLFKTSISVEIIDIAIALSKIIFGIPVCVLIWVFASYVYSELTGELEHIKKE